MSSNKSKLALPILFAAIILVPLGSLYFHGKPINRDSMFSRMLASLASPGQRAVASVLEGVSGIWFGYIYLVDVEKQNEALLGERKKLLDLLNKCQGAMEDNARLQRLLDFRDSLEDFKMVSARVVARDTSPYFRVLRVVLDRGEEDGVAPGMPVLNHLGVIGRVERVSGVNCDVMLLTDSRSRLSATVVGKGITGMLMGSGDSMSYSAIFQFPFQKVELEADDLLVTTGHEQIFPKGLEVGRLVSGSSNPSGKLQEVQVVPAVDFGHLEDVLIITNYHHSVVDPWAGEVKDGK